MEGGQTIFERMDGSKNALSLSLSQGDHIELWGEKKLNIWLQDSIATSFVKIFNEILWISVENSKNFWILNKNIFPSKSWICTVWQLFCLNLTTHNN